VVRGVVKLLRSSRFVVRGFGPMLLLVLADVFFEAFACLFEPRPKGSVV